MSLTIKGEYLIDDEALEGKVALITGASSGIGKAVSEKLAKAGFNLALAARSEMNLKEVGKKLENTHGVKTLVLPTDVSKPEEVKETVKDTIEEFGVLDVLISNAGVIKYGKIEDFSTADYKYMMETNCDGMFYCTREALPHLEESKGNLIYIGSFDANHPRSFNPIYAASKWWTKGFAHSIESIVGKEGVAVTLINPSEVRTNIRSEKGNKYREKFDVGEVTEPKEVAEAVLFAVKQEEQTTISEINLFRRNKLSDFF